MDQSGARLVYVISERFHFRDWKIKIKLASSQVVVVIKSQDLDLEVKRQKKTIMIKNTIGELFIVH